MGKGLCGSRAGSASAAVVLSLLAVAGGPSKELFHTGSWLWPKLGMNFRYFFSFSRERGWFILEYQCLIQMNPLGKWS